MMRREIRAVKRATDPQGTILQRFGYGYDPAGNRLFEQIDDSVTAWTYDRLNRLVTQQAGGLLRVAGTTNEPATVRIQGQPAAIDATGVFVGGLQVAPGTTRFTVTATDAAGNTAMQQYDVDQAGPSKAFTFDANGNLTADGTRTFEWDARDRVVSVVIGTHRVELTYDGIQRRVRVIEKESGAIQTDERALWCEGAVCEERTAAGDTVVRRTFAHGEWRSGTATFLTRDHLGSVREATDASNLVLGSYDFDPWGRLTVTGGSEISTAGFTGHRRSQAAGLWVTMYREYDPELGRWLSEDPIGLAGGINLFSYVHNRPHADYDLYGLKVSCASRVTKRNVSRTNCGAAVVGGCTTPLVRSYTDPCKREPKCGTWGFKAWVDVELLVEFNAPRTAPSKETKGVTLEAHEMLHVADFRGWCGGLDKAIKTEGFKTKPECDQANGAFESRVLAERDRAGAASRKRRD